MCREAWITSMTQGRRQNAIVGMSIERATRKGLVAQAIVHAHGQTGSSNVDIHSLHAVWHLRDGDGVELEIGIAGR